MEAVAKGKKANIKELFRYRNYLLILIANFISRFGDSIDSIAYGWMVYQLTGSKLLLGTLYAINALPNIIFGPFAGVIADKINKKKAILFVFTGRGIIVSLTAVLFFTGLLRPWHLFVFTIINSTLETLGSPIFFSIIPRLLPKELYLSSNSFSSSAYKFAELIGMGTAGVIIALLGTAGAIFIDSATFFIAAFIILFISIAVEGHDASELSIKKYFQDLKEGFLFVWKNYVIKTAIILFAITNFSLAPINVLLPAYVDENLKSGAEMLSAMGCALSVGIIVGGLCIGMLGNKAKIHMSISMGLVVFGICYSLMFLPGNIIPAGILSNIMVTFVFFMFGCTISFLTAPLMTNIMQNTDKDMFGRVGALISMVTYSAIPLGSAITGSLSELVPTTTMFIAMGIMIFVLGIRMLFNLKFKKLAG